MTRRRIAIVVQRYGEEVNGGAELHARWLAERLQQEVADITVLTTCAVDYTTWADVYPAGESVLNGVTVRRFPVDEPRDWPQAQKMTWELLSRPHSVLDEQAWIRAQGPVSTKLLNHIEQVRASFDVFIFFTYLYATTYYGLPLVAEKAILVPTAHEEPYLYLPLFRPSFQLPRAIIYNTETEREMVQRVTQNQAQTVSIVAGIGINLPERPPSAERFRQRFGIEAPFAFYVGRITSAKNVPEMVSHFIRYKEEVGGDFKLVLAGKKTEPLPEHPDVIPIGFVTEEEKFDGLAAAQMSIMPSLYESLSMIALEAWLLERPMVVNGHCLVLKNQCRLSQGGLYYHNYEEFAAVLAHLRERPKLRRELGQNGRDFVHRRYHWEIIMAKYQAVLNALGI